MSVANDGISRFVPSTIYAPLTVEADIFGNNIFVAAIDATAIECASLTATAAVSGQTVAAVGAATAATLNTTGAVTAGTSVVCANYSSLASPMTLSSGVGVYLSGTLTDQDAGNPPAALVLANIPFCASFLVTAPRAFILPAGSPQGFRATFFVDAGVVVTFASPDTVIQNYRNTNGALVYAELPIGTATPNLGQNAFIQVASCNGRYIVMSWAA